MTETHVPAADTHRGRGIAALLACAVLWSSAGLFIKIISWNPMAIAGMRSLFGGLTVLVILRRPRFTWTWTQILCAVAYAGCMILFVTANKLTTAANAILLQYTAPVYVAILGGLLLGERVSAIDWVTVAVVIGGMTLFFLDKLTVGGMWGNIIAVVSGVFFASAIVLLRKQKHGSPLESILLSHGITFLVCLPFVWRGAPSLAGWGGIAFLGIFQIGLASALLSYGVKHVSALGSILTSIVEPLFNPLWVFLAVGEKPGPFAIAGGIVIVGTVTARSILTILRAKRGVEPRPRDGVEPRPRATQGPLGP
jgi:drug/metabolite transporter (DMT)-like permease